MYTNRFAQTYYCRSMSVNLIRQIEIHYAWLIDYVKQKEELDFQTGHDPKTGRSWFSVYRGTGRIFTIECLKNDIKGRFIAADRYKELGEEFFNNPSPTSLNEYLQEINNTKELDKYYINNGKKKEGFYQNLISRRYTFKTTQDDNFIIIDKEFVLGFETEEIKKQWCQDIEKDLTLQVRTIRDEFQNQYAEKLPSNIKTSYGEFDFLGLGWNGDIWIMELKQSDPQKTYLSPVQVKYYDSQLSKFMSEDIDYLYERIREMVEQKIGLGLIELPSGKELPDKLSGNINTAVIVGDDIFSDAIIRRFKFFRQLLLPDMKAYTCDSDGSLTESTLN